MHKFRAQSVGIFVSDLGAACLPSCGITSEAEGVLPPAGELLQDKNSGSGGTSRYQLENQSAIVTVIGDERQSTRN
jgi:hypothetical protein